MKTVIFTYKGAPPERTQNSLRLKNLLESLDPEIFLGGEDTIENTVEICKLFEDDLLILEDDVKPCEEFKDLVLSVISKYKDSVINFHYNCLPKRDSLLEKFNGLKLYRQDGSSYIWNQCFYLPSKIRELIIKTEMEFRKVYPYYVRTKQQDVFIAYSIRDLDFIAVYPSLVEHLDLGSSIRDSKSARTIFPFGMDFRVY